MADFEHKSPSLAAFEPETMPCEILRLVQFHDVGYALPMLFHVHAYVDNHVLKAAAETAKEAFAKAIEWHVVGRLRNVSISDGTRSYSITEFASVMAIAEIANTQSSAEENAPANR
jgi:hypothetical protein